MSQQTVLKLPAGLVRAGDRRISIAAGHRFGYNAAMARYVRAFRPGGTFFLTLVTERRAPVFARESARLMLHAPIERCRRHHPLVLDAMVLLPDHLHMVVTLPDGDADFSIRVTRIKSVFTREYLAAGGTEQERSQSRMRQRSRGVWLKRFREHTIRDPDDLRRHFDYIHYNPVKHRHVKCPHAWMHSSFHRFVAEQRYAWDWCCQCELGAVKPLAPAELDGIGQWAGE